MQATGEVDHINEQKQPSESIRTFTRDEVAGHTTPGTDCYTIVNNNVYDISKLFENHPGGTGPLKYYSGKDASIAFADKGHSVNAFNKLLGMKIGEIVESERISIVSQRREQDKRYIYLI